MKPIYNSRRITKAFEQRCPPDPPATFPCFMKPINIIIGALGCIWKTLVLRPPAQQNTRFLMMPLRFNLSRKPLETLGNPSETPLETPGEGNLADTTHGRPTPCLLALHSVAIWAQDCCTSLPPGCQLVSLTRFAVSLVLCCVQLHTSLPRVTARKTCTPEAKCEKIITWLG